MFKRHATMIALCTVLAAAPVQAQEPVAEFQQLLADRGCAVGTVDGQWGRRTTAAAAELGRAAGIVIERPVTGDVLAQLAATAARCGAASSSEGLLSRYFPPDVWAGLQKVPEQRRTQLCPVRAHRLAELQRAEPFPKLEGLTSSMANARDLPAFRSLDEVSAATTELAAAAALGGDQRTKRVVLAKLAEWAAADAYLGTRNCSNGDCPSEWQTERGTDLSPEKDSDSVLERIYPIAFAYHTALADYEPEAMAAEHRAITRWLGGFGGDRLRNRGDEPHVYVGFGMGWGWHNMMFDLLNGREDRVDRRLQRIAAEIGDWLLADGAVRERTFRGSRAIWYHFAGLNEILLTLEVLKANGIDKYPELEARLHKAVEIFVDALEDPVSIYPWAKEDYRSAGDPTDLKDFTADFQNASLGSSWPYIYVFRYPEHPTAQRLLAKLKELPTPHLGDAGLGYATPCLYRAAIPELLPPGIFDEIKDFDLAGVSILPAEQGDTFWIHRIAFRGAMVGGEPVPPTPMVLNRDFSGPGHQVEDITLFRYMFFRRDLIDPESREADFSGCDGIAVQEREGDQQLRLHIGFESEKNQCILSKMGPRDRMMWEAIITDFDAVLAVAKPGPEIDHIRRTYEFMTR